jgi:hypothetical protein
VKRRTYLATAAGVVAALAGCTGELADSGGTDPDRTEPPTDGTTGDGTTGDEPTDGADDGNGIEDGGGFPYAVTGIEADDPPVEAVTVDATAPENFSTDHPARVEVAFTNEADESRTFQFGSLVPWDGIYGAGRDGNASLLLAPTDGVVPGEPTDGCWRATDGIALPAVMRSETLDPGETVSREYALLAAHDSDACHPPVTYRFESEHYLGGGWGFDVTVDRTDDGA